MSNLKIKFHGGVDSVTGANFLLAGQRTKILVDCGIEQGSLPKCSADPNLSDFDYNPAEMDYLIVTHAHADHIGRIPKLVKDGFRGTIYSTPATLELVRVMYQDALNILRYEAKKCHMPPMYSEPDVHMALALWQTIPYYTTQKLNSEFELSFSNAGHILGSAIANFRFLPTREKIVFTGDLGNEPSPLLKEVDKISDADYLIMESVYGDRNHADKTNRRENLREALKKVIERRGTALIPVFSLEKTQVLLHELNHLIENQEIKSVPVFFDSPLGLQLTEIYADQTKYFRDEVQEQIKSGDDIFDFPKLVKTPDQKDAIKIHKAKPPKIIIASSGMSVGGRIIEHEMKYLSDPRNAIFFIGYQSMGSLGRDILNKKPVLQIYNKKVPLKAEVIKIDGYSSHMDSDNLVKFVSHSATTLKKVFVVMGEPTSAEHLAARLKNELKVEAVIPKEGETVEL